MSNANDERFNADWFANVLRRDTRLLVAAVPLVILVLSAGFVYWRQFTTGMGVTGLNRPSYWGLYIVNCVFFVGVSAGGILIASLVHALGVKQFRSVARIAELMAISCVVMAVTSLFVNLCWPQRMHFILLYANVSSPILWDMLNVSLYFFISLAYGYFGTRSDLVRLMSIKPRHAWLFRLMALGYTDVSPKALKRDDIILRVMAVAGLLAAVGMHSVTAWILGLTKARPGWFSAIMAPLFIVSAAVSGLALLIVSVVLIRRYLRVRIKDEVIRRLAQILTFLVLALGYFLFAEMLTVFYGKEPAVLEVFETMMHGRYAVFFWGHLLLGLIFPLLLFGVVLAGIPRRWVIIGGLTLLPIVAGIAFVFGLAMPFAKVVGDALPGWVGYAAVWIVGLALLQACANERLGEDTRLGIAAGLVVLGIFAERWNIVLPSLMGHSALPLPGVSYAPSGLELLLVAGIYAMGALVFIVAVYLLPLVESEEDEPPPPVPDRSGIEGPRWTTIEDIKPPRWPEIKPRWTEIKGP
ncbi:MAG: NrfD/PsrC family molybdoenzyme membrane anchor subunit [Deltaproteobacteria bacterium]|nr:NrfD/PsrC family molybdoenzyme membrane anchor subunit [Deltaproteobacteria bacterium]